MPKPPAKRRKKRPLLARGVKASVVVDRGTGRIVFDNVPPQDAPRLLAATMQELRRLSREAPELVPDLGQVGGYTPVPYEDDLDWYDGRRRIGFTAPR